MSAIVNSNNVIFANGGGDFPVSASFVVGGIDNSTVSTMTFQVVRPIHSVTGNTVTVRNEMGNTGEFVLIPYAQDAGLVYYNSGHIDIVSPQPDPTCSAYVMTTGNPSVTLNPPNSLLNLRITTPYNYDGPSFYTATIGNRSYTLGSGCYVDFTKAYDEENELGWHEAGSGYWSL